MMGGTMGILVSLKRMLHSVFGGKPVCEGTSGARSPRLSGGELDLAEYRRRLAGIVGEGTVEELESDPYVYSSYEESLGLAVTFTDRIVVGDLIGMTEDLGYIMQHYAECLLSSFLQEGF